MSALGAERRAGLAAHAKLEAELGISLVDRTRMGALLTEAGERVVARGRVRSRRSAITDEVGELTGLRCGTVRIGVTLTPGPLNLARELAGFHSATR